VLRQALQAGAHLGGVGVPLGGLAAVLTHQVAGGLDVDDVVAPQAQRVDRAPVGVGEQSGAEVLLRVVAPSVVPGVEEGALQDVLGLVRPDVAVQVDQLARGVCRVRILERRVLTTREPQPDCLPRLHVHFFVGETRAVAEAVNV